MRSMTDEGLRTPPAVYEERKCEACSLKELCMPQAMRFQKGAAAWFARQMAELSAPVAAGVSLPPSLMEDLRLPLQQES